MKYTGNYNLKKPEGSDIVNIEDLNDNADIIDQALKSHDDAIATKETPQGAQEKAEAAAGAVRAELDAHLADEELHMTQAEKTKLAGLPNDAVNAISPWGDTEDPNTTTLPYIVTSHPNSPTGGWYWHIRTYFYGTKSLSKAQIAVTYTGSTPRMFIRHVYEGTPWTPWVELTPKTEFDEHLADTTTAHGINTKVSKAGDTMTGILTAQSNTSYTVRQVRNIILSTADADVNAMQNGDIWIKYK